MFIVGHFDLYFIVQLHVFFPLSWALFDSEASYMECWFIGHCALYFSFQ